MADDPRMQTRSRNGTGAAFFAESRKMYAYSSDSSPSPPPTKAKPKAKKSAKAPIKPKSPKMKVDVDKPKKPRKALSGFNYFYSSESKRMKECGEGLNYGTLGSHVGDKWRSLSDAEREPYMRSAKADSARYARERDVNARLFEEMKRSASEAAAAKTTATTTTTTTSMTLSTPRAPVRTATTVIATPPAPFAPRFTPPAHTEELLTAASSVTASSSKSWIQQDQFGEALCGLLRDSFSALSGGDSGIGRDSFSLLSDVASAVASEEQRRGASGGLDRLPSLSEQSMFPYFEGVDSRRSRSSGSVEIMAMMQKGSSLSTGEMDKSSTSSGMMALDDVIEFFDED
jgi:high mobility group protein B1